MVFVETFANGFKKVEALVHYGYKMSKGNLMALDIQGICNILCDPEIAAEGIIDINDEFIFCFGDLAINAIQAFLGSHERNAY